MSLQEILGDLVASEPFERLLLERARPILARAEAGEDFVIAGARRGARVPGPRRGARSARGRGARGRRWRRSWAPTRVALLPAWEALPYEGISRRPRSRPAGPTPSTGSARRGGRSSWSRRCSPRCRALIPTLGAIPPLELVAGRELAARRAGRAARRPRLRARRRGRAPRRVRGPRRRRRRVPRGPRGVPSAWSTGATRSSRSASSRRRRSSPPTKIARGRGPAGARADPRRRPCARGRGERASGTPTGSPTGSSGWRTACSSRGRRRSRRCCSTTCPRRRSCCPTASWVVLTQARRTLDRARRRTRRPRRSRRRSAGRGAARCIRSTRRSRAACSCGSRSSPKGSTWGCAMGHGAGERRRSSRTRLGELAERGYRLVAVGARPRLARARDARWSAPSTVGAVEAPLDERLRVRGRRSSPSRPRRTCSARGGTRGPRRGSPAAGPSRSPTSSSRATSPCTASTASGRYAGHHAPRARRRRARLPDPGVRAGRQAVRALGPGRHGREATSAATRRGCTAWAGRDWARATTQGQARRPRHGGRARAPLHGAHVGARPRVRPRHAVAAGAGGRVPPRGDRATSSPRSTR